MFFLNAGTRCFCSEIMGVDPQQWLKVTYLHPGKGHRFIDSALNTPARPALTLYSSSCKDTPNGGLPGTYGERLASESARMGTPPLYMFVTLSSALRV